MTSLKKIIIAFFVVVFILILGFAAFFGYLIKKPAGADSQKSVFDIPENTSTVDIASDLRAKNLINSNWAFILYSKITRRTLLPGAYLLSSDMTIVDIANKLSSGDTAIRKITIPEGWRTEQVAQYLVSKKAVNYNDFINAASGLEGKLFPDTYYISVKSTAPEIVKMMNDDYLTRTKDLNLSAEDLIIASIVEKEAKSDADRPVIAGIFKNRFNLLMKLESNPTVQYAYDTIQIKKTSVDASSYVFWKSTSGASFASIISPYNTYINSGLPPAPICNPGMKSIEATINYTKSDYYYFLHDANDLIHLSKTFAEHEQKVNQYLK